MKFLSAQFRELVENLLDIHVDFDLLDESELEDAVLDGPQIQAGEITYSCIIIPEATTLSSVTAAILADYAECGGKILFINGRPNSIEGDETHPLLEHIQKIEAPELQNTRHILQKYFRAEPIQDDYNLFDDRMENEVSGIVSHYGRVENGAVFYLFNRSDGHDVHTVLRHKGRCRIQCVNLIDGNVTDVETSVNNEATFARFTIESGAGILLKVTYEETMAICRKQNVRIQELEIQ